MHIDVERLGRRGLATGGGVLMLAAVMVAGLGNGAVGAGQATPTAPPVVREVLNEGFPVGAPGQVLELVRYTIVPGTQLAAHTHPGMQVAWVEAGTLGYTVIAGTAEVRRGTGNGTPAAVEPLGPGAEALLATGDGVVEPARVVHFGRNAGDGELVILAASLFAEGEPASARYAPAATPVP